MDEAAIKSIQKIKEMEDALYIASSNLFDEVGHLSTYGLANGEVDQFNTVTKSLQKVVAAWGELNNELGQVLDAKETADA